MDLCVYQEQKIGRLGVSITQKNSELHSKDDTIKDYESQIISLERHAQDSRTNLRASIEQEATA
jgi:hypothetical protein